MSHDAIANLGSLVSQAEVLRSHALGLMQVAPGDPVAEADLQAYGDLHRAAIDTCGYADGVPGVAPPEALADVAALHRSAGLLEHELLRRLAQSRVAARDDG